MHKVTSLSASDWKAHLRLRRPASAAWTSFHARGSTIRQSPARLYSGRLRTRANIVGCHPSSAAAVRIEAPPRTRSNARRTSAAASGSNLDASRATASIAVGQFSPLSPRARIPLRLALSASSHPSDDHAPVIRRHSMSDAIEQHRRRIAGTVSVRAIRRAPAHQHARTF